MFVVETNSWQELVREQTKRPKDECSNVCRTCGVLCRAGGRSRLVISHLCLSRVACSVHERVLGVACRVSLARRSLAPFQSPLSLDSEKFDFLSLSILFRGFSTKGILPSCMGEGEARTKVAEWECSFSPTLGTSRCPVRAAPRGQLRNGRVRPKCLVEPA